MRNEFIKAKIRPICTEMYRKNKLQNYKVNEDTTVRVEIHSTIVNSVNEGLDEKQILEILIGNFKYKKYETYFSNWISDAIKKASIKNKLDDNER